MHQRFLLRRFQAEPILNHDSETNSREGKSFLTNFNEGLP